MRKESKIYLAGHSGTLGQALLETLVEQGYKNLVYKTHKELDLTNQAAVSEFFAREKPEYVILAAAKLDTLGLFTPANVLYENAILMANVLKSAYENDVKKLIFYGSAWAYPQSAKNPIKEEDLLNAKLDEKAIWYGLAKILGTKMCEAYNLQYNTNFITLYLANLYGKTSEFDLVRAKVLPALLRKFHLAKLLSEKNFEALLKDLKMSDLNEAKNYLNKFGVSEKSVEIWGSGGVIREFIHAKDLAAATLFVLQNVDFKDIKDYKEAHLNVGSGEFLSIRDLAFLIKELVGFDGEIKFNTNKPDSSMHRMLDSTRLNSLGWSAKIKLKEGVKMMYEWYQTGGGFVNYEFCFAGEIRTIRGKFEFELSKFNEFKFNEFDKFKFNKFSEVKLNKFCEFNENCEVKFNEFHKTCEFKFSGFSLNNPCFKRIVNA